MFKFVPGRFLETIVAHELEHAHDKVFSALRCHLEPVYHQLEYKVRVYLTHLDADGHSKAFLFWRCTG